jgi:hypothetical protein
VNPEWTQPLLYLTRGELEFQLLVLADCVRAEVLLQQTPGRSLDGLHTGGVTARHRAPTSAPVEGVKQPQRVGGRLPTRTAKRRRS